MRSVFSLLVIVFAVSGVASAQKAPQPKKVERVQYYKVEYHRFRPGKADEGRAFIRKHFRPADRAAGIEVLEFTPITGDWDWIAFFPVEADFLAWERSPMSLRARAKFEQMAGGAENAKKLDKEFNDLVQELRIEIMARDLDPYVSSSFDSWPPQLNASALSCSIEFCRSTSANDEKA